MAVTIQLPEDVERRLRSEFADLEAEARGAFALELFRRGRLSIHRHTLATEADEGVVRLFVKPFLRDAACIGPDEYDEFDPRGVVATAIH